MAKAKGTRKGSAKTKRSSKATGKTKAKGEGRKYKEVGEMSERMQAYQDRFSDAIAIIGCRMVLEHNRGLFLVQMPDGSWQVGNLSSTGKSFKSILKTEDREEAVTLYRENRTGNYGGKKATKKGAAKKGTKKSRKGKGKKAAKPADEDDFDLEDELE